MGQPGVGFFLVRAISDQQKQWPRMSYIGEAAYQHQRCFVSFVQIINKKRERLLADQSAYHRHTQV